MRSLHSTPPNTHSQPAPRPRAVRRAGPTQQHQSPARTTPPRGAAQGAASAQQRLWCVRGAVPRRGASVFGRRGAWLRKTRFFCVCRSVFFVTPKRTEGTRPSSPPQPRQRGHVVHARLSDPTQAKHPSLSSCTHAPPSVKRPTGPPLTTPWPPPSKRPPLLASPLGGSPEGGPPRCAPPPRAAARARRRPRMRRARTRVTAIPTAPSWRRGRRWPSAGRGRLCW